jgi:Tfp pilus assembly protein PilP
VALLLNACSDSSPPTQTAPARPPQPPPAAKAAAPPAETKAPTPEAPPYIYEVKGRRDPFRPLVAPRVEVKKPRQPATGLVGLEVTELKLVGIIWERRGYFALVEAPNGKGYVLRLNDTVGEDARVTKITPQGVTFEVKDAPAVQQAQARAMELRLRKEE